MVARRTCTLALLSLAASALWAGSLKPSHEALLRQVEGARGLTYAHREADVETMVGAGALVRVRGDGGYELKGGNPWPYAHPQVVRFLTDLGRGYREICGERLVVTSLVRPRNHQPRNASPLSVHPTGTAIDLRVPWKRQCRSWLEGELTALEDAGVIEAAREYRPPHYHAVLFPEPYLAYLGEEAPVAVVAAAPAPPQAGPGTAAGEYRYVVQRGDTLWGIAKRYGTETSALRAANGLSSSALRVGQRLRVPTAGTTSTATSSAAAAVYRVRPGDNLWRIALRYGTVVGLIQQANGLSSTHIFPGQVLHIPGAAR